MVTNHEECQSFSEATSIILSRTNSRDTNYTSQRNLSEGQNTFEDVSEVESEESDSEDSCNEDDLGDEKGIEDELL